MPSSGLLGARLLLLDARIFLGDSLKDNRCGRWQMVDSEKESTYEVTTFLSGRNGSLRFVSMHLTGALQPYYNLEDRTDFAIYRSHVFKMLPLQVARYDFFYLQVLCNEVVLIMTLLDRGVGMSCGHVYAT